MFIAVTVILGLILLACLASPLFTGSGLTAGFAIVPIVLFVIATLAMSFTKVDARSVGIETSYGKYVSTLSNGPHWIAPWASVEEFSTQIQPLHMEKDNAVPVAFKGGSSGDVSVVIRWKIEDAGAENLWKKYKTFDNVRDQYVESESKNSFRDVFSQYNPVDAIDGTNLSKITTDVQNQLGKVLGTNGISIDSVSVTNVHLGDQAQASLNRIVSANAETQTAEAQQNTAKIQAETAAIQAQTQTPETLLRHCLDIVQSWDAGKQGPLPATFNCAGIDGNAGAQAPVIVNAGK